MSIHSQIHLISASLFPTCPGTSAARLPITTLGQLAQTCLTPLCCFLRNLLTKAAAELRAEPRGPFLSRSLALHDAHHEVAIAPDVFLPKGDHVAVPLGPKQEVMVMALLIVAALAIIVADAGLPIAGLAPGLADFGGLKHFCHSLLQHGTVLSLLHVTDSTSTAQDAHQNGQRSHGRWTRFDSPYEIPKPTSPLRFTT